MGDKKKLIGVIGIGIVVAVYIIFFSGLVLQALSPSAVVVKAKQISYDSLKWTVVHNDPLSYKYDINAGGMTTKITMEGDSDLPTTKEICDRWEGRYSTSQSWCDLNKAPNHAISKTNNLVITVKGKQYAVSFSKINNGAIEIKIPSYTTVGCTRADIDNDVCIGVITGSITLGLPEQQEDKPDTENGGCFSDNDCGVNFKCNQQTRICEAKYVTPEPSPTPTITNEIPWNLIIITVILMVILIVIVLIKRR